MSAANPVRPLGAGHGDGEAGDTRGPGAPEWKRDVALEISVDVEWDPVAIRLSGVLDGSTAANVIAVVEELIVEGFLAFDLDTDGLDTSRPGGLRALADVRRLVERFGGRLDEGVPAGPSTDAAVLPAAVPAAAGRRCARVRRVG